MCVSQNIPTLGTVAVTMALHNCDEVAVAGFGYNMSTPDAPLHYYERVKMFAIKEVTELIAAKRIRSAAGERAFGRKERDSLCLVGNLNTGFCCDWTVGVSFKLLSDLIKGFIFIIVLLLIVTYELFYL